MATIGRTTATAASLRRDDHLHIFPTRNDAKRQALATTNRHHQSMSFLVVGRDGDCPAQAGAADVESAGLGCPAPGPASLDLPPVAAASKTKLVGHLVAYGR